MTCPKCRRADCTRVEADQRVADAQRLGVTDLGLALEAATASALCVVWARQIKDAEEVARG